MSGAVSASPAISHPGVSNLASLLGSRPATSGASPLQNVLGASSPLFSTLGRGMGSSISPLGSSGAGQGMLPNASQGMAGAMPAQNSVGSGGGGFGGQGQGSAGGYPGFGSYAGNDMGIGTPLGGAGIGPLADAGQPGSAMASTSPGSNKKTPQGKSDIMPTVIVTGRLPWRRSRP